MQQLFSSGGAVGVANPLKKEITGQLLDRSEKLHAQSFTVYYLDSTSEDTKRYARISKDLALDLLKKDSQLTRDFRTSFQLFVLAVESKRVSIE